MCLHIELARGTHVIAVHNSHLYMQQTGVLSPPIERHSAVHRHPEPGEGPKVDQISGSLEYGAKYSLNEDPMSPMDKYREDKGRIKGG